MDTTTEQVAVVSAQVPLEVRERLLELAREGDRTLSAQIRRVLVAHVDRQAQPTPDEGAPE